MKLFLMLIAVVVFAAPALSMQSGGPVGSVQQQAAGLMPLPALNLQDFDGNSVASDKFKGNIVVLDFWATWCGPCIIEIPAYNKLQEKYAAKGVKVVGVTMTSGEAKDVKQFLESPKLKHKMKYTVLMGDDAQAYDFNIVGFPTTYLITRDGKIFAKYIGAGHGKMEKLESDIEKILADSWQ
jgi:thiol-disulfide isomerase/thioredoxin